MRSPRLPVVSIPAANAAVEPKQDELVVRTGGKPTGLFWARYGPKAGLRDTGENRDRGLTGKASTAASTG